MKIVKRYKREDGTVVDVAGCTTKGCKYETKEMKTKLDGKKDA